MKDEGMIALDVSKAEGFLPPGAVQALAGRVAAAAAEVEAKQGPGAEFLGWSDLPDRIGAGELAAVAAAADGVAARSRALVVIGIGGSYLGARAVLAALGLEGTSAAAGRPEIMFAGTGLCSATLHRILERLRDKDFHVCVISKSGTTLEPAIAFRILRSLLVDRYGPQEAARRIIAITDPAKGALRAMADDQGYLTFAIPGDIGGRFSVLTPVGLVPLAVAGADVPALVAGAKRMRRACRVPELRRNPAHLYAAVRYALYTHGYTTEILSTFHGDLQVLQEWWKQLFGESEGKHGLGIFPASAVFTTDLHSLGQYIQDGRRTLLETFLCVKNARPEIAVPGGGGDGEYRDGLEYLAGRSLDTINWKAYEGTRAAHLAGGVPCLSLEADRLDAGTVGGLLTLFQQAVAISGKLLGVNPFDQPGVETYKKEMFRLLGKP